jgi:diaminopropionate ammonia-lyase
MARSAGPRLPVVSEVLVNPWRDPALRTEGSSCRPMELLHGRLPGYRPTPLRECRELARSWRVGRVLVKDESSRLGLPAFKVLGASWAVYQLLLERTGLPLDTPFDHGVEAQLRQQGSLRLVTATDGNHGRAVAHVARMFGLGATIFLPADSALARIEAICDEGAHVKVVVGDYDEACAAAAASLDDGAVLVSDTFWPGHERVPRWISEGYATLFMEIDAVEPAGVDVAFVPVGVGALAEAAIRHHRGPQASRSTRLVCVEPVDAACVTASLRAGRMQRAPGPHRSAMVGLNCGTPSEVAWPLMRDGFDTAVTVDDDDATEAMRALARLGIGAGATGAASCAGAARLLDDAQARAALGLDESATVLVLSTEGVTDLQHYRAVVGPRRGINW